MNSWMSYLNSEGLTAKGRRLVRLLVLSTACLALAGAPQAGQTTPQKKAGEADKSAAPPPITRSAGPRYAALKKEFRAQIHELVAQRLVLNDLLRNELDKSADAEQALIRQRNLEEFLLETELQLLEAQATYARQIDRDDVADKIDTAVARIRQSLDLPQATSDQPTPAASGSTK